MTIFDEARVWKVTAGAGCGKSYFIESTIDSLIASGVQISEIAYILFNRTPADAFRDRFLDKGYEKEDVNWISTHHSMCKRLLGLKLDNILDLHEWGKKHGFDFLPEHKLREDGFDEYGWDSVFSRLQSKIYRDVEDFTAEESRLLEALKKTEVEEGKYTFIRFLQKALKLDRFPAGVKYVFLDEAQDNSKLQLDWLQRIVDNRPEVRGIMLAGDDKQAINGFKGGDAELFLNFPCDRHVQLKKTYRMPMRILQEANRIISPVRKRSELTDETAVESPGRVIYAQTLEDAVVDVQVALKAGKSVLILLRNRCFEAPVVHVLTDADIMQEQEWTQRTRKLIHALWSIRSTGVISEAALSAILPSDEPQWGELMTGIYWDAAVAKKIRTGDIMRDKVLFNAYEDIRLERGFSLADGEKIGMTPQFIKDIGLWSLDPRALKLGSNSLYRLRDTIKRFGWHFPTVRVDTIHAVKGEEADVVVLVGDITGKTFRAEQEDEDSERRVWHVAASRAKDTLIITNLNTYGERTEIL